MSLKLNSILNPGGPAVALEHERGNEVEEPAKSFKPVIEGCRQIYPEEWQIMVLQDKLKLKKESK